MSPDPISTLISPIVGKLQEEATPSQSVPRLQVQRLLRPHGLASGPEHPAPSLFPACSALAPQRTGTVQHYILLQLRILFPVGLGPKSCHFAAVSAYGSWASRMPGDTAGSLGEAAELPTRSAMSLWLPTASSPRAGPSAPSTCSQPFPMEYDSTGCAGKAWLSSEHLGP